MNNSASIIELTGKGVYRLKEKVAERLYLRAIGRREADNVTLAQVRFRTIHGNTVTEMFEWSYLLANKRHQIKSRLADLGYEWPEDTALANAILKALAESRPARRVRIVLAPGWYRSESGTGLVLVRPNQVFAPNGIDDEIIIDPNSHAHIGAYLLGEGSLQGWKETVAKPARKSSRLRFAIGAAFAAPLLRLLNMDSFGTHFFGDTSVGKSTTLWVAASVDGLIGEGGLPGWADSERGLEDQMMGYRDGAVPIDESADGDRGEADLRDKAKRMAYAIARNRPRKLARTYEKEHGLTDRDCRNIVLSAGERGLGAIARSTGVERLGGEEARLMDIPACSPGSQGIFDGKIEPVPGQTLQETTRQLVDRLKTDGKRNQGYAGSVFLRRFVRDPGARETVIKAKTWFETKAKISGDHNIEHRIQSSCALIYAALEFAIDCEILPWKKRATFEAIEKCMRDALAQLTLNQTVAGQGHEQPGRLIDQLKKRLADAKSVQVVLKQKVTADQVEERKLADAFIVNGHILLKSERLKTWFPDQKDRGALTALLKEQGVLEVERDDTATCGRVIGGIKGKPRYYVLRMDALNEVACK